MIKQDVVNEIINRIDSYYILDSVLDQLTPDEQKTLEQKGIDVRTLGEIWYKFKEHIKEHETLPKCNEIKLEQAEDIGKYIDFLQELIERLKQEMIDTIKTCFDKKVQ